MSYRYETTHLHTPPALTVPHNCQLSLMLAVLHHHTPPHISCCAVFHILFLIRLLSNNPTLLLAALRCPLVLIVKMFKVGDVNTTAKCLEQILPETTDCIFDL